MRNVRSFVVGGAARVVVTGRKTGAALTNEDSEDGNAIEEEEEDASHLDKEE